MGVRVCVWRVLSRLDRVHRLADKVQHDCRTSEELLDDVERRLQQVTEYTAYHTLFVRH